MNHGTWKSTAVLTGALLITSDIGASAEAGSVTTSGSGKLLAISTNTIRVLHRSVTIDAEFEPFTHALEKILGHFPEGVQQDIIERPQRAEQRLKAAEGAQELMIFLVFDHGAALNMVGARRNAKQYLIGNPLTAIQMSQHDIRAALYAPLRVLVYEQKAGQTIVEYDQPSSLFGQFGEKNVTDVALALDTKLERALAQAAELARR
jgi:uncharacterized protein (DUF302 family)